MTLDKTFKANCIQNTWVITGQTDRDTEWAEPKAILTVYKKRNEPVH